MLGFTGRCVRRMFCSSLHRAAIMADRKAFARLLYTRHRERFPHDIAFAKIDFPHGCLFDEIITERKISLGGFVAIENVLIFIHINQQLAGIIAGCPVIIFVSAACCFIVHVGIDRPGTNHRAFLICVSPGRRTAARASTHIVKRRILRRKIAIGTETPGFRFRCFHVNTADFQPSSCGVE